MKCRRLLIYLENIGNKYVVCKALNSNGIKFMTIAKKITNGVIALLEAIVAILEKATKAGIKEVMVYINNCHCWKILMGWTECRGQRRKLTKKLEQLRKRVKLNIIWVTEELLYHCRLLVETI